MLRKRGAGERKWRDLDDAPELIDDFFGRADVYHGDKLISPGKGGPNPGLATAIRRKAFSSS